MGFSVRRLSANDPWLAKLMKKCDLLNESLLTRTQDHNAELDVKTDAPALGREKLPLLVHHPKKFGLPTPLDLHWNRVSSNRSLCFRETEFFAQRQRRRNIPEKFTEAQAETNLTGTSRPIGRQLSDGQEISSKVGMRGGRWLGSSPSASGASAGLGKGAATVRGNWRKSPVEMSKLPHRNLALQATFQGNRQICRLKIKSPSWRVDRPSFRKFAEAQNIAFCDIKTLPRWKGLGGAPFSFEEDIAAMLSAWAR
jgi:hypothetical protein